MDIKFMEYVETPTEKHLGIATIMYGSMLLRFKIQPGKDGQGFYAQSASHKVTENGQDKYLESFLVDSRIEHGKMMDIVREGVKQSQNKEIKMTGSIFDKEIPF